MRARARYAGVEQLGDPDPESYERFLASTLALIAPAATFRASAV